MVRIERSGASDSCVLLPLISRYWQFEAIPGFDADRIAAALRRMLSAEELVSGWTAFVDGTPAGYLLAVYVYSLEHLGMTAEIDEFFVLPEHRGQGLGGRLLAAAEEEFRRRDCTNVSLQVGVNNAPARAFYLRHGYAGRAGYTLLDKMLGHD